MGGGSPAWFPAFLPDVQCCRCTTIVLDVARRRRASVSRGLSPRRASSFGVQPRGQIDGERPWT